jgi:hypothetical protein
MPFEIYSYIFLRIILERKHFILSDIRNIFFKYHIREIFSNIIRKYSICIKHTKHFFFSNLIRKISHFYQTCETMVWNSLLKE